MNKIFQKVKSAFVADGRFSPAMAAVLLAIVIAVNGIVFALTTHFGLYFYKPSDEGMQITDTAAPAFEKMQRAQWKVEILFCMAEDEANTA